MPRMLKVSRNGGSFGIPGECYKPETKSLLARGQSTKRPGHFDFGDHDLPKNLRRRIFNRVLRNLCLNGLADVDAIHLREPEDKINAIGELIGDLLARFRIAQKLEAIFFVHESKMLEKLARLGHQANGQVLRTMVRVPFPFVTKLAHPSFEIIQGRLRI